MTESPENIEDLIPEDSIPDRPMECTECKKPIAVHYTEIMGGNMIHTMMCNDCPILQQKLKGSGSLHTQLEGETDLCCGNCGTTLESVRMGNALGCSTCYEVFGDILLPELLASNKISPRITPTKRSIPIHIGRSKGEAPEINPSLRLLALNEALNETLKREDYEQAAWLRDQIKALTEKPTEKNEEIGKSIPQEPADEGKK